MSKKSNLNPPGAGVSTGDYDAEAAAYARELGDLLFREFCEVLSVRQPDIVPVIRGEAGVPDNRHDLQLSVLEAWGIWFQLLNIVEENTAMRRRRHMEKGLGVEQDLKKALDKVYAYFPKLGEMRNLVPSPTSLPGSRKPASARKTSRLC